jgi:ubiquinone/menaquinone biosynthesis C-methylase UbiE
MAKSYFDERRSHMPSVGLPRNLLDGHIVAPEHAELLRSSATRDLILSDETPIPAPEDRENYYGDRHIEYWLSGRLDWLKLRKILDLTPKLKCYQGLQYRYLDMGGATGRVARHAARETDVECWLSDINVNWIDWLDKNFAYELRFYQSRTFPSIPIEDNSLSMVSAFSVFTHLDCDEMQWILELRRVLAPGGMLYITTLDRGVWDLLKTPEYEWLRQSLSRGNKDDDFLKLIKEDMPGDRFIWEYSSVESYNINVFLSREYIQRSWSKFFEIVSYQPFGHGYQTAITLRKKL